MDIAVERSYPTPVANSPLLPLLLLSLARDKHTPDIKENVLKDSYDFIVVGGGSAGSVMASRLSEIPCVNVLLLEAGISSPVLTDVPSFARTFVNTNIDWQYHTVPQKHTGNGLVNKQLTWPSGRAIGGSSIINAMIYIRGNRENYDDWEKMGAKGWSYDDVLPYFMKMEDNQDPEFIANGFHGVGGPVTVMQPNYNNVVKEALINASKELGYDLMDPNGPTQTGFNDLQATYRDGQRCSAAKAYLVPAENRTNLDILPNATVTKILLRNKRAYGVSFNYNGTDYNVTARKEVILSAGAINSAQLLMLSGIGPRLELMKHGIKVEANLPVGKNLQDHCGTFQAFELNDNIQPFLNRLADDENVMTYIHNRTEVLSSIEGVVLQALLNNSGLPPPTRQDYPDHQLYFQEGATIIPKLQFGLKPEVYEQVFGPYEDKQFYFCITQILHPKSRGTVTLKSSNPYDEPNIDPNYFEMPCDLNDVVKGMQTCLEVGNSESMKSVGSKPFDTLYPGCELFPPDSYMYLQCQARSAVVTLSHQVGTAKMGNPQDPTTVVDPKLRVKTIRGLRVVDASIMPTVPSGNTNVPTMMVAEKASDMIKETIKC